MAKDKNDNTATLGFEVKLWHAVDLKRGKLPTTQYCQVLMGLLFPFLLFAAEVRGGRVRVADGDTITALDAANAQHKIRFHGIDAPESHQICPRIWKRS